MPASRKSRHISGILIVSRTTVNREAITDADATLNPPTTTTMRVATAALAMIAGLAIFDMAGGGGVASGNALIGDTLSATSTSMTML